MYITQRKSVDKRTGQMRIYEYLVESHRDEKGNPRQEILMNLNNAPSNIRELIINAVENQDKQALFFEKEKDCKTVQKSYGLEAFFLEILKTMGIYDILNVLDEKSKAYCLSIIINRLIDPKSKLQAASWIENTALPDMLDLSSDHLNNLYRAMDKFNAKREEILECFSIKGLQGATLFLYDITSVYFEGAGPACAEYGYSRDKRPDNVQILIGLGLNDEGELVYFDTFEGNVQDKQTVIPAIEVVKHRYNFKKIVFIGDRGMITAENIGWLEENELGYIFALRHKAAKKILNDMKDKVKTLFDKKITINVEYDGKNYKHVVCGSEYRRKKDLAQLEKILEKGLKALQSVKVRIEKGRLKNTEKIIKTAQHLLTKSGACEFYDFTVENNKFKIIEKADNIEDQKRLCGYYILQTTEIEADKEQIKENYIKLQLVERAFRNAKEILEIRPVRHFVDRRVLTHVYLTIIAQSVIAKCMRTLKRLKWLDAELDNCWEKFKSIIEQCKLVITKIKNVTIQSISNQNAQVKRLLELFNIDLHKFFFPKNSLRSKT